MVSYTHEKKRGLIVLLIFLMAVLLSAGFASGTAVNVIVREYGNITYVPAQPFSVYLYGNLTIDNTANPDPIYSVSYTIGNTSHSIGTVMNGSSDTRNWNGSSNLVRFEENVTLSSDGHLVVTTVRFSNHFSGETNISITKNFTENCTYYDVSSDMYEASSLVDPNNVIHVTFSTTDIENTVVFRCVPDWHNTTMYFPGANYTIKTKDILLRPTFAFLSNSYFSITKTKQTQDNYSMEFIFENRDAYSINLTEVHLWAIRIPTGRFIPDNQSEMIFDLVLNTSLPLVPPNGTYQTSFTFLSNITPVVMASVDVLQEMNYTYFGTYTFDGVTSSVWVRIPAPPPSEGGGGAAAAGEGGAKGGDFIVKDTVNKLRINPENIRAEPGEVRKFTFRVTAPETNKDTLTNIKVKSLTPWAWPQNLIIPVLEPGQSVIIEVLVKAPYELKEHDIKLQFVTVTPLQDDIKTIKLQVVVPGMVGTEIMPDIRIIKNVEMLDETHYNISIIVISLREDNLTNIRIKDDISMLRKIVFDPMHFNVTEGALILTIPLLESYNTMEFNYYGESPELIDVKKAELIPDDRRLIALSTTGFIRFSSMGMVAGLIKGISPFWIEMFFLIALLLLILLLLFGRRRKKKKHEEEHTTKYYHKEIEKLDIDKLKKDVERLREMRKRFETHEEGPTAKKKGR